jgi:hypothetical protein
MATSWRRHAGFIVPMLVLAACGRDHSAAASADSTGTASAAQPAAPSAPAVLAITATDYAFDAPAEIPAGLTTIRVTVHAKELHHAALIRIDSGKTFADLQAALRKAGPPPHWAVPVGGPNTPVPNDGTSEDIQELAPGNYAIICYVPSPDGTPHFDKGMIRPLTVTASTQPAAPEPTADATVTLSDYAYGFSAPLAAGKHMLRVENAGPQVHELVLVRLAPGKKGKDLASWVTGGMKGPPPGMPLGGVAPMAPGTSAFLPIDLEPGNYAMLCFVPDAKDGKDHAAHGMIKDFTIGT